MLYDDKKIDKQLNNKLIYEIENADDFTTALLMHLFVREVPMDPALIRFADLIKKCGFKDADTINQFNGKHSRKHGSLQQALDKANST